MLNEVRSPDFDVEDAALFLWMEREQQAAGTAGPAGPAGRKRDGEKEEEGRQWKKKGFA